MGVATGLWDDFEEQFKDNIDGTQLTTSTYEDFFHYAHNVVKVLKKIGRSGSRRSSCWGCQSETTLGARAP